MLDDELTFKQLLMEKFKKAELVELCMCGLIISIIFLVVGFTFFLIFAGFGVIS